LEGSKALAKQVLSQLSYTPTVRVTLILKHFPIFCPRVDLAFNRFSRQQLRTAYVRAEPNAGNTNLQSSIIGRAGDRKLSNRDDPARRSPDRHGPGWANYFWFTSPGITPFKAVDNLNGRLYRDFGFQRT